jgi:hypothetical protein
VALRYSNDALAKRSLRIATLALIVLTAGCSGLERTPQPEAPETAPAHDSAVSGTPAPRATLSTEPRAGAPEREPRAGAPERVVGTSAPAAAQPSQAPNISKTESPSAKVSAAAPGASAPAAHAASKESPPDTAKQQATPPLDLALLETRLKETKAIGLMTKMALKNQVDDLLNQFRASYQGQPNPTRAQLRKSFDLLVVNVIALLHDGDPSLASAIVASRETIWGVLCDPTKFANLATI